MYRQLILAAVLGLACTSATLPTSLRRPSPYTRRSRHHPRTMITSSSQGATSTRLEIRCIGLRILNRDAHPRARQRNAATPATTSAKAIEDPSKIGVNR